MKALSDWISNLQGLYYLAFGASFMCSLVAYPTYLGTKITYYLICKEKIKNPLSEIILKGQLRNGAKINAELREEDIQLKIENQD